jgi:hypothetical protein
MVTPKAVRKQTARRAAPPPVQTYALRPMIPRNYTRHIQPGTQRTAVPVTGSGGLGLHKTPPHPSHQERCIQGCMNTSHTQQHTHTCISTPQKPFKHTPQPCTNNILQCLQLGQVDQSFRDGSRTRGSDTVAVKAAYTRRFANHTNTSAPAQAQATAKKSHKTPTSRPRTHSRQHNVQQCLQLRQVDQASTNGRRTRVTESNVSKAAQAHTTNKTAPAHTRYRTTLPWTDTAAAPLPHNRPHNLLQYPQLRQVDQGLTNGHRTHGTDTVVSKAAQGHHTPRTQQHKRNSMPTPGVPVHPHTSTTAHTAGAGGPGLHQRQPRLRHQCRSRNGCTNTSRTYDNSSAYKCHRSAVPCKRTQRQRTHSRAHNVHQPLQLGQVDKACTNGCRTRVTY